MNYPADRARSPGEKLALAHSGFYLLTGVWPMLSPKTFQAVTGPKVDFWLVNTAGALISAIGAALGLAALHRRVTPEIKLLAIGSALGLTAIDVIYVARRRISPVYLLDAAAETALIAGLGVPPVEAARVSGARDLLDTLNRLTYSVYKGIVCARDMNLVAAALRAPVQLISYLKRPRGQFEGCYDFSRCDSRRPRLRRAGAPVRNPLYHRERLCRRARLAGRAGDAPRLRFDARAWPVQRHRRRPQPGPRPGASLAWPDARLRRPPLQL